MVEISKEKMSRHQKSVENSSLYRSTIDNIVREDNEQSVTEDLKVFYTFSSVIPFHTIFNIVSITVYRRA